MVGIIQNKNGKMMGLLMRCFFIMGLIAAVGVGVQAQTTYVMGAAAGVNGSTAAALNGSTVTINCGTTNNFRDSGGSASNYGNNENITVTFCSNGSNPLYFDFRAASGSLNLDTGTGDTLYFYDANTNALITTLTMADDYSFSTPSVGTTSTCVRVVWHSNGSVVDGGWDALITCTPPPTCSTNPPAADMFAQAPTICNLNGYCGATDSYYGEDAPFNFAGTGGGCPAADGLFGGTLENNSWIRFEALSTTAVFNYSITGGGTCSGLQAGGGAFNIATSSFTLMSPCTATTGSGLGTGTATLTATGLTVGSVYYLMMDGTSGSVCNYNITVNSGVAVANAGTDQTVCGSATLAALSTATGGTWSVVSGTGTFANPSSPTTTVTGLSAVNVFRWTTTTSLCGTVSDDITISNTCPCSISALALGTQTACNAADNTYTQQITVTYTNAPSSGTLVVNGQNFAIGASPQTVTLTGLAANGLPVNVTVSFSASPSCTFSSNNLFTAPGSCSASPVCTPNNGTWD